MASFLDQYEELFGPRDPYRQLDVPEFGQSVPRQSALPTSPDEMDGVLAPRLNLPEVNPPETDTGLIRELGTLFGAGVGDVAGMFAGAAEYGARGLTGEGGAIQDTRESINQFSENLVGTLDAETQRQLQAEFLTLDPERSIWTNGVGYATGAFAKKIARAAPTFLPFIGFARLLRAASPAKAFATLGATEATLSIGGIQNGIADEINAMSSEDLLAESERFRQLLPEYEGDAEAARQQLIREAQGLAPILGGAATAGLSLAAGRYLQPILEGTSTQGVLGRFGAGFTAEGATESGQGATQQLIQNISAKLYDEDRQLSEGVAEAAVQEGAIGGALGGGISALSGRRTPSDVTRDDIDGMFDRLEPETPQLPGPQPAGLLPAPQPSLEGPQERLALPAPEERDPGTPLPVPRTENLRLLPSRAETPINLPDESAPPQRALPLSVIDDQGEIVRRRELRDTDIPQPEEVAVEEEAAQDPQEVARFMDDLFPPIDNTLTPAPVTAVDQPQRVTEGFEVEARQDGEVVQSDIVETAEEAEELADSYANQFPEANVATRPYTRRVGGVAIPDRPAPVRDQRAQLTEDQTIISEINDELVRGGMSFDERQVVRDFFEGKKLTRYGLAYDQLIDAVEAERKMTGTDNAETIETLLDAARIIDPQRFAERRQALEPDPGPEGYGGLLRQADTNAPDFTLTDPQQVEGLRRWAVFAKKRGEPAQQISGEYKTQRGAEAAIERMSARFSEENEGTFTFSTKEIETDELNEVFKAAQLQRAGREGRVGQRTKTKKTREEELAELIEEQENDWTETEEAKAEGTRPKSIKGTETNFEGIDPDTGELVEAVEDDFGQLSTEEQGALVEEPKTLGGKLRLIRREAEISKRREAGIRKAFKVANITLPGMTSVKGKDGGRKKVRKTLKTRKLFVPDVKQDESVADRIKRVNASKEARTQLTRAIKQVERLRTQKNSKLSPENFDEFIESRRDSDGNLDVIGFDALMARQYLTQVKDFGQAMVDSNIDTVAMTDEMKRLAKVLQKVATTDFDTLMKEWAELARANEEMDLGSAPSEVVRAMREPKVREKATQKQNRAVANRVARIKTLKKWNKNWIYRDKLKPIQERVARRVADIADGLASNVYIPNEQDIADIAFSMPRIRRADKKMFNSMKQFFSGIGFDIDPETGEVDVESYGTNDAFDAYTDLSAKQKSPVEQTAGGIRLRGEQITDRFTDPYLEARNEREKAAEVVDKVQAALDDFKAKTAPSKVTVAGLIRQERRFIARLEKLGAWKGTAPGMGQIIIGREGKFRSKTYRKVENRLNNKTMKKDAAKQYIQKYGKIAAPKILGKEVREVRKREGRQAEIDQFIDQDIRFVDRGALRGRPKQTVIEAYRNAFRRTWSSLQQGENQADTVLQDMVDNLPEGNAYRITMEKVLESYDASDGPAPTVRYSRTPFTGRLEGFPAFYRRRDNLIALNPAYFSSVADIDTAVERLIHALTHEAVHSATLDQMRRNPAGVAEMEAIRQQAQDWWFSQGGTVENGPYGLFGERAYANPNQQIGTEEFVAEAFSNPRFQEMLKKVPVGSQSLWTKFKNFIKRLLGMQTVPDNAFEAVMERTDEVFGKRDNVVFEEDDGEVYISADTWINDTAKKFTEKAQQSGQTFADLRGQFKGRLLNLMTMRQLRDTYRKYFDTGDGNLMDDYTDSWTKRNRMIAELMGVPKELSSRWTKLESSQPEMASRMSKLMTEATLFKLSPSEKVADDVVMSAERRAAYDRLRKEYLALSPEARKVYDETRSYYRESLSEEGKLLMAAALRGILTKGAKSTMTLSEFKRKFTPEVIDGMKDRESIEAALEGVMDADEIPQFVEELERMADLRSIENGDYFPLMRYGDWAVFAEKVVEEKTLGNRRKLGDEAFTNLRREAMMRRAAAQNDDPTLDVGVFENSNGDLVYRVTQRSFVTAESRTEAEQRRAELIEEFGEGYVGDVTKKINYQSGEAAIGNNSALNSVLQSLSNNPEAMKAIKNYYLRSLNDQAFRKREIKRKNRAGVDYEVQHRNLAMYSKQSAYYRAQLQHGWRMGEAIQEMYKMTQKRRAGTVPPNQRDMPTDRLQEVVRNLDLRDKMTGDAMELNKMVRKGVELTQFMLLTSPSYWMINYSQPWLVSAPVMAGRHSWAKTLGAMKDAQKLIYEDLSQQGIKTWGGLKAFSKKSRDEIDQAFNVINQLEENIKRNDPDGMGPELVEVLEELKSQNIIDINVLTELRELADGVESSKWARTMDASRILAHLTEVNNRVLTAVASYKLEKQRGLADGMSEAEAKEVARKYAADMVSQTQFDYSSENKPPLFRAGGPLKWAAPLMFQFMQWPQHMYALLIKNTAAAVRGADPKVRKEARDALLGLLGTHAAVGGMVGMALQPIKWAFGMAMLAFGDDDEPYTLASAMNGRAFDDMITRVGTDLFGPELGAIFARGLPTAVGADLSGRMSMGTLYFVDLRGDTAESVLGSLALSFGGATLSQTMNWGNALSTLAEGDMMRAVEQASPKIAKDVLKAYRYYNQGMVNRNGDTVMSSDQMDPWELFIQTMGFQPDDVSKFYQRQSAIKGAETFAFKRKKELQQAYINAESPAELRSVRKQIMDFNRAFPSLRIKPSTISRGRDFKRQRELRYQRYGANVRDERFGDFERYGAPYE